MRLFPDDPPRLLGDAMSDALDRAIDDSMSSLRVLHDAVRRYAIQQRGRGIPLDEIMRVITTVQLNAEDDRPRGVADTAKRDPVLTTQLRAWCSEAYSAK